MTTPRHSNGQHKRKRLDSLRATWIISQAISFIFALINLDHITQPGSQTLQQIQEIIAYQLFFEAVSFICIVLIILGRDRE